MENIKSKFSYLIMLLLATNGCTPESNSVLKYEEDINQITRLEDGSYQVSCNNQALDENFSGMDTVYAASQSKLICVDPLITGHTFQILPSGVDKVLDVPGESLENGTKLILWTSSDTSLNQFWQLKDRYFENGVPAFTIRNINSDKCIDSPGGSTQHNEPLTQYDCNGGSNQRFQFFQTGNGWRIKNSANNLCLATKDSETHNGAAVVQANCSDDSNQIWELKTSSPLSPDQVRTQWKGWGTSLAWWAKVVGLTSYQEKYADLLFTENDTEFLGRTLPGLGFNIVRYNIGGGGLGEAIDGQQEIAPEEHQDEISGGYKWFRYIDGFWLDWKNDDAYSSSFDWTRDPEQRSLLQASVDRGVDQVEFFSNAPMWWMMKSNTSAGGDIDNNDIDEFAKYLAITVDYAQTEWGIEVDYIAPFNEPSAGWWKSVHRQEGANIFQVSEDKEKQGQQSKVIQHLKKELKLRNLDTPITSSDENTMADALKTWESFKQTSIEVEGQQKKVSEVVEKVNVHSYGGLSPWRNNGARRALSASTRGKELWMSEYGDDDNSGAELAQTIMEDLAFLRPSAWVYWQAVEHEDNPWGLINSEFNDSPNDSNRGKPQKVYNKFYTMAHFSRFIKPGMSIIDQLNPNAVFALDKENGLLNIVIYNREKDEKHYVWDLSAFSPKSTGHRFIESKFNGSDLWRSRFEKLIDQKLRMKIAPDSIVSISISLNQ